MKAMSLEQTRRRIENIESADRDNRQFFRRHRIHDYMPGQVTYNLGDYPARFSVGPTEYDYEMLKELSEKGVELLQVHEEWNDAIRCLGADKFSSFDPEGMKKFVEACHSFGIKIIPYISTGYFEETDPDFREDFTRGTFALRADYFNYRKCSAGSPTWRKYLLDHVFEALDEYGFDGVYNDWGYDGLEYARQKLSAEGKDPNAASVIEMPYDPILEDLLSEIYTEVKRRGGSVKIHADRNNTTPTKDKVYDYLWIGENVSGGEFGIGKGYEPYVVPCRHTTDPEKTDDDYYVKLIPFMQFPLLKRGRPIKGIGIDAPVPFRKFGDYGLWSRVKEYHEAHPEGPHCYSLWSSIPDNPRDYENFCKYLALYKPMVTENSVAYIELRESAEILSALPENVFASMFVNEEKYMVVSNLTEADYTLELRDGWKNRETGEKGQRFTVKPTSILFLVKE